MTPLLNKGLVINSFLKRGGPEMDQKVPPKVTPKLPPKWTPRRAGKSPKPFEFIVFSLIRPPRKGSILGHFWLPFGVALWRRGSSSDSLILRILFFHNNCFFNSIPAAARGLEKHRSDFLRLRDSVFPRQSFFIPTISCPAGALEKEIRLKWCNSI